MRTHWRLNSCCSNDGDFTTRFPYGPAYKIVRMLPALLPALTSPYYSRAWIFDSPEGFGEWRILIASGAHGNLRVFHKKESNMFDIVIRKIK
jgi:hypothetical protein